MFDDYVGRKFALPGLPFPAPGRKEITACSDWNRAWANWHQNVIIPLDSTLPTVDELGTECISFAKLEMFASTYVRIVGRWLEQRADMAALLSIENDSKNFKAGEVSVDGSVVRLMTRFKALTVDSILESAFIPCGADEENDDAEPEEQTLYYCVRDMRGAVNQAESLCYIAHEVARVCDEAERRCNEKLKEA